jgi:hypothetical protein
MYKWWHKNCILFSWCRVARFLLVETYQNGKKYAKGPKTIPNGNKLYRGRKILYINVIKYTNISIPRPSKFYPNWDFWFENKPPGTSAMV